MKKYLVLPFPLLYYKGIAFCPFSCKVNKMICSKCKKDKDENLFHKDRSKKNGRKSACKSCRAKKHVRKKIANDHKDLDISINKSMYRSIKNNKSGYLWEVAVGYTLLDLKERIEQQFDDVMNWDNYGSYWVLDKIIPTSFYRYGSASNAEFRKAWSLKNIRPYPKHLHNKKRGKIILEILSHYNLYDILPAGIIGDSLWQQKSF